MSRTRTALLMLNAAFATILMLGLEAPSGADAQTGPKKYDCCKTSVDSVKFCCDQCCSTGGTRCSSSEFCNLEEQ